MRRLVRVLCLSLMLVLPSMGLVSFAFYKGPLCADIQKELVNRVKALISLHTLRDPPEVELLQPCGHSALPDALWFDIKKGLIYLGLLDERLPLSWQNLRILSTQDLLADPNLGASQWVVRFDAGMDRSERTRLIDLLRPYLEGNGRSITIEARRVKTEGKKEVFPVRPFTEIEESAKLPAPGRLEPILASLKAQLHPEIIIYVSMFLFGLILLHTTWKRLWALLAGVRSDQEAPRDQAAAARLSEKAFALFGPYFLARWRERTADMMWTFLEMDPEGVRKRVAGWQKTDREALYWALIAGDEGLRRAFLRHFSSEELCELSDFAQRSVAHSSREELRALSRFLLVLGRALNAGTQTDKVPLFLHLLCTDDWQQLASQLSRNRRRVLARRLNGRRAIALQIRSAAETATQGAEESEDIVWQKLEDLLRAKEAELIECLGSGSELQACLSAFFAQLLTRPEEAETLKLVFLAGAALQHRSFSSSIARGDRRLALALAAMDNELAALTLFDCEKNIQEQALSLLPERTSGIKASLSVLHHDKLQQKKWKMRSKAHQRFLERQVLIADLFTSVAGTSQSGAAHSLSEYSSLSSSPFK